MAYLGRVPGERSSGATIRRGAITKAGNSFARKMLLESAWSYRRPARIGVEMGARMPEVADPVREIAWKAQIRLCGRFRRRAARGKKIAGSGHRDGHKRSSECCGSTRRGQRPKRCVGATGSRTPLFTNGRLSTVVCNALKVIQCNAEKVIHLPAVFLFFSEKRF